MKNSVVSKVCCQLILQMWCSTASGCTAEWPDDPLADSESASNAISAAPFREIPRFRFPYSFL